METYLHLDGVKGSPCNRSPSLALQATQTWLTCLPFVCVVNIDNTFLVGNALNHKTNVLIIGQYINPMHLCYSPNLIIATAQCFQPKVMHQITSQQNNSVLVEINGGSWWGNSANRFLFSRKIIKRNIIEFWMYNDLHTLLASFCCLYFFVCWLGQRGYRGSGTK